MRVNDAEGSLCLGEVVRRFEARSCSVGGVHAQIAPVRRIVAAHRVLDIAEGLWEVAFLCLRGKPSCIASVTDDILTAINSFTARDQEKKALQNFGIALRASGATRVRVSGGYNGKSEAGRGQTHRSV